MSRPRKIQSPEELMEKWEQYKTDCDNQTILTHEFSAKNSQFVSKDLRRSMTYTVKDFCGFLNLARQNFYGTYVGDDTYRDIITRIREACEVDARKKFELGIIPTRLAGLWMSKHGYSLRPDSTLARAVPLVITGGGVIKAP